VDKIFLSYFFIWKYNHTPIKLWKRKIFFLNPHDVQKWIYLFFNKSCYNIFNQENRWWIVSGYVDIQYYSSLIKKKMCKKNCCILINARGDVFIFFQHPLSLSIFNFLNKNFQWTIGKLEPQKRNAMRTYISTKDFVHSWMQIIFFLMFDLFWQKCVFISCYLDVCSPKEKKTS